MRNWGAVLTLESARLLRDALDLIRLGFFVVLDRPRRRLMDHLRPAAQARAVLGVVAPSFVHGDQSRISIPWQRV